MAAACCASFKWGAHPDDIVAAIQLHLVLAHHPGTALQELRPGPEQQQHWGVNFMDTANHFVGATYLRQALQLDVAERVMCGYTCVKHIHAAGPLQSLQTRCPSTESTDSVL